jgi:hypothetical protein
MSDTPQGPGWWQASDAKWYPPEQSPGVAAPVPPVAPPPGYGPPPQQLGPPPGGYAPMGYAPMPKQGMNGCLKAFLIVLALSVVLLVAGGIAAAFLIDDAVDDFVDGDSEEANDVQDVECEVDGAGNLRATVTVRNDSSERSNYIIQVSWEDDGGTELTSSAAFINGVQPGDRADGDAISGVAAPTDGDADCAVTGVQRFSDETGG